MKSLHADWLTSGWMDAEYKRYLVLAYLQEVRREFSAVRLYPALSDLLFHYQNLLKVKKSKDKLYDQFPQQLSRIDLEKLTIEYRKLIEDDELMQLIEQLVAFALPKLQAAISEGEDIYHFIEQHLAFSPLGIEPLWREEGYVLLHCQGESVVWVYVYRSRLYYGEEPYRDVRLDWVDMLTKSAAESYESLKMQLLRRRKDLPLPATFLVVSQLQCPLEPTLLPMVRKILMKHLDGQAA